MSARGTKRPLDSQCVKDFLSKKNKAYEKKRRRDLMYQRIASVLDDAADGLSYDESLLKYLREKGYEAKLRGSRWHCFRRAMRDVAAYSDSVLARSLCLSAHAVAKNLCRYASDASDDENADEPPDHIDILCGLFRATTGTDKCRQFAVAMIDDETPPADFEFGKGTITISRLRAFLSVVLQQETELCDSLESLYTQSRLSEVSADQQQTQAQE